MPTLRAARRAPPRRCSNNPLSPPPPATRSAPASKRHDPRPPHSLPASRAHARTPSCGRARTGAVGTRHPDTAISAHGAGTESPSPPCVPPPPSAAAAPGTAAASGAPAAAGGTYEASNLASSSGAKNCLQTRAGRCCQLRAEKKGAQAGATASNKRICGWTRSDAREARRCIGLAWADAWRPCAMCAYTTPCPGPFSRTRGGVQARRRAHTLATTDLPSNLRPCNFSLAVLADATSLKATKILPMCSSAGVAGSLGGCGTGMTHATTSPNLVHSSICRVCRTSVLCVPALGAQGI